MIWLPATLLAALFQAWRTAVQQRVRSELSVNGAGLVRYLYGLPVCVALLTGYLAWTDAAPPQVHGAFWFYAFAGGLAQVLATNLLIMAFGFRNFVTGTAYAKTEAMQGAVLATIFLGEHLPLLTWGGIAIGVLGVLLLSTKGARLRLSDVTQPAALCGLGAGLLFGLTAVLVKAATLVTETPDRVLAALTVLVSVVALQLLMQGTYIGSESASSGARCSGHGGFRRRWAFSPRSAPPSGSPVSQPRRSRWSARSGRSRCSSRLPSGAFIWANAAPRARRWRCC